MERATCHLCEIRPPRRECPALGRQICAVCCGTEREQSIGCPLDCPYLREARLHEKPPEPDQKAYPNPEIELSERYMQEQQQLAMVTGSLLLVAATSVEGAVDSDVREALDSLAQTFKTAQSGLIYESRPANLIAAGVVAHFQQSLAKFREDIAEKSGSHSVRDKDVLGMLVFWQRMHWQNANGRRKGRAFIEQLYTLLPETEPEEALD